MHTVSNGTPPNTALDERWWRTFSSNLTCVSLIVAHLPTITLLQHLFSAIDLSIAHPALYLDFSWQIDSDLHGSDHYPIVITANTPLPLFAKPTWNLHKADWAPFSHQAALEHCTDNICSAEDLIQEYTDVLIKIANNSISKSKPNTKKHNTIWCNEDCKSAIKTRNKAHSLQRTTPNLFPARD